MVRWRVLVHCGPYKENKKNKGRGWGMAFYFAMKSWPTCKNNSF
jgi:hypothetical protein